MAKLAVKELLILSKYDGRATTYELPIEVYGLDYKECLEKLVATGYLKVESSLSNLTIPSLKEILRRNNQKISGKKEDLIKRIVDNVPAENYADELTKLYVATDKGRLELSERQAYIENQKMQYGFLNSEIAELEGKLDTDAILEQLFLRDITKHGAVKDYGLLRNTYYNLGQYFKKRGRIEEYLRSLLSVIYYDLSGASNGGSIDDYAIVGYALETSIWTEIDKARTALNYSDEELLKLFDEAVEISVKVPFSYFDTATMKKIILDRLRGEMNLLQKYKKFSRQPPKRIFEYADTPIDPALPKEIEYVYQPPIYKTVEEKPKPNRTIWLSVVAVLMVFLLLGFVKAERQAEKERLEPVGRQVVQTSVLAEDPLAKVNVKVKQDALQDMFQKLSVNTTEQELQNYIETAGLFCTSQDGSAGQFNYKIGYRKSDTYHTRSTGGDYLEIAFDKKTGKFLNAKYFNSKSSIELIMTSGVLRGHNSSGRANYYLNDINSYKGLENAEECYSAQDALNRLETKLATL